MEQLTPQIVLTLAIIALAMLLFATEKLRVDVIALLVLLTVVLTGLIGPEEAFAGFANPAVVTVWAVYIVSGALFKTGVADVMGERIARLAGGSEPRLIAVIMLTCGIMSAFMNNVGATAMLLPAVIGISRQTKIPASRLLIPLSFSSLLGGELTLIGTPANILAAGILTDRGLADLAFFDFVPTGLVVFATGILYMVFLGRHLLPTRERPQDRSTAYQLREYVSEIQIVPDSKLVGQTLLDSRLGADYDLIVIALERENETPITPHRDTRFQPQDLLLVKGAAENLMRARLDLGLTIETGSQEELADLETEETTVVEATLAPHSRIVGRNLREVRFRDRFGFTVLAIYRQGEVITQRLRDVRLQFGDALLMQGHPHRLPSLQQQDDFLVLEPVALELRRRAKAPLAVGTMILVLVLVILAGFHISVAMVIGAVLMVLAGCLTMDEAYQSIDWRTVFLVAGMLPLGTAMATTGTARFLADLLLGAVGGWGPLALLAGIYLLVALITQPMSNAAAVVLVAPIAIDTALSLGADPKPFVMATVIGAATSFLTPVGHKANVLVFGPGGYRFFDYTRVGWLLTIALVIVTLVFLPLIWPLFPA